MVGVMGEYGGWTGEAEFEEGEGDCRVSLFRIFCEEEFEFARLVESVREGMVSTGCCCLW